MLKGRRATIADLNKYHKEVKAMAAHIKTFKDKYLSKGQRRRRNNQPGEAVCEGSTESW